MATTEKNNAIAIWNLLSKRGKLSFKQIADYTKFQDSFIKSALGRLSKEDKVTIISDSMGNTFIEIKNMPPDIYY